ncbi:MAG: hypothetical protein Q8P41_11505 [Pseudomonadota bacterium]|nr:hypothetical protein [Pseudomonadota bacterium]
MTHTISGIRGPIAEAGDVRGGKVWRGRWDQGAEEAAPGTLVLFSSWALGEPERGRYDDGVLVGWRRAVIAAKKRGADVWVVAHAGALPDWQIAREGWLDPDALANWGCWIDRLGRGLAEAVGGWIALWDPVGEAACYDGDARRAGRVLLDAQAAAYLQLHRGTGAMAREVAAAVTLAPPRLSGVGPGLGVRDRMTMIAHRFATEGWVRAAASGRLGPPFAITGELPNGTAALDRVVVLGEGPHVSRDTAGLAALGRPITTVVGDVIRAA